MEDCNSEYLEVSPWMEIQGLTNTICDLHGYSDALITYKQSKELPINGIYCSYNLASKRGRGGGGVPYFGRIVGDHQDLWIDINEIMILCFQQHDIILTMGRNLRLEDPRTIKKLNDTLHTSFVKHYIYQNIHYINNQADK